MKTFLAVEDDELIRHLYERSFRVAGQEIEIAKDGEEALEKLSKMEVKPSVILLDIMMPKMNGFDVLEAIKKDDTLKDIPVIMLTNLGSEEDREKGLALGALDYLVKSDYNPSQVVEKVIELTEKNARATS
jgi:DNA-binding response OmpR family regulator